MLRRRPLGQENFSAPFSYRLLPRKPQSAFAIDSVCLSNFDNQLLSLDLDARNMPLDESPGIH